MSDRRPTMQDEADAQLKWVRADIAQAQIDAAVMAERERCAVLIAKFDIPEDAAAAGTSFCRDAPSRVFAAAIRKGEQP